MISIAIICSCLTIIVLASLVFAAKQEPKPKSSSKASIAEKRRLLERQREVWFKSFNNSAGEARRNNWASVDRIDRELLALAEKASDKTDEQ